MISRLELLFKIKPKFQVASMFSVYYCTPQFHVKVALDGEWKLHLKFYKWN